MLVNSINCCLYDFAVSYCNVRTRIQSRSDLFCFVFFFSVLIQHCLNVENTAYSATVLTLVPLNTICSLVLHGFCGSALIGLVSKGLGPHLY